MNFEKFSNGVQKLEYRYAGSIREQKRQFNTNMRTTLIEYSSLRAVGIFSVNQVQS